MTPENAKNECQRLISESGMTMSDLTPERGVQLMLEFYRDVRVEGCDLESDGDMLLLQWGTHEFGEGRSFQFDLTRQFILAESEGDDGMTQLSLTFHFDPTIELDALTDGNRWCSTPGKLKGLESFIAGCAAYKAIRNVKPEKVTLECGEV